jgi:LemA protein
MKSRGCLIAAVVVGAIAVVVLAVFMWGVGINNRLVTLDEGVKSAWSQVENQYQRRADLIPNLVETVKGYANQEQDVFIGVAEARAKVSQMTVTKEVLDDPKAFAKFQSAQDQLGSALSRLLVVSENYTQLKSNENFLSLQTQLEGTENRITVERKRFNDVVQSYNTSIRQFPVSFIASFRGFREKPYFQAKECSENAPQVKF